MTYAELIIAPARAEIALLIFACAILLGDLFVPQRRRIVTHFAAVGALLVCAYLAAFGGDAPGDALGGFFAVSPLSDALRAAAFLTVAASLAYSRGYLESRGMFRGEFYALALFAALGMAVMIAADHFLVLYLGLELLSLCLYAMIALPRDDARATESAMKYFVLGALSSGLLLYGVSMIYGATGALGFGDVAAKIAAGDYADKTVLVFGLVFLIAGIAFKIGAAPFHMWLPDVYHGAPAAMTLFVGAAPKIAAFALALRILASALPDLAPDWRLMLAVLAIASLAIGNITAIAQTNFKRMLAYSAIAHSGFLLLGFIPATADGYAGAMFYILIYALSALGGFGMITLLSRRSERDLDRLDDLRGLAGRGGFCALLMLILMFSMAGVPPAAGFYAKLAVLQALIAADFVWLAVVAVLLSVVGAFYYLRVIKLMFFDKPTARAAPLGLSPAALALAGVNGALILYLGLFPGALLSLCERAVSLSL